MDWYDEFQARGKGIGLPTRERPDEGHFVRGELGALEYVWTERGQESVERVATVEDLLWCCVRDTTFWQGVAYEFKHRKRGEDVRRQIFAKQIELCEGLGFGDRARARVAEILAANPFDDQLARRAERWDELVKAGMSREEAVARATGEFPDLAGVAGVRNSE